MNRFLQWIRTKFETTGPMSQGFFPSGPTVLSWSWTNPNFLSCFQFVSIWSITTPNLEIYIHTNSKMVALSVKPMFTILVVSLALLVAIVLVSSPSPFSQSSLPSNSPLSVFSSLCFSSCFCFINWVFFFPAVIGQLESIRKWKKLGFFLEI